jgi:hypothetical protein
VGTNNMTTIWDEWKAAQEHKRQKKEAKNPKEPVPTRQISIGELNKLARLHKVSTAWGSQDYRFIHQFDGSSVETQITERQAWYIDVLIYKYRRQLGLKNAKKPEGYRGRNE